MGEATRVVMDFIRACDGRDVAGLARFFTPDCIYHNIPMEPVHGPEAAVQVLMEFAKVSSEWDWQVHHLAEGADGVVLTERTDRIRDAAGAWHDFPTMGAFEVRDGKISAWRDYFDLTLAMAAMRRATAARAAASSSK